MNARTLLDALLNDVDPARFNVVQNVSPAWLLKHTTPDDDPTWEQNFQYIESNHVPCAPKHWDKFLKSCARSIRTPLVVWKNPYTQKLKVCNGHHRLWAAVKLQIPSVPVVFNSTYTLKANVPKA